MREIKFRAWNIEEERMIQNIQQEYDGEEEDCFAQFIEQTAAYGREAEKGKYHVMQYTGLKDENGVEIYEGDIIQWSDYEGERKAEVKYGIGEFGVYRYAGFYLEGDGRILEPYEITNMIRDKYYYSYKVVGNIFEGVKE